MAVSTLPPKCFARILMYWLASTEDHNKDTKGDKTHHEHSTTFRYEGRTVGGECLPLPVPLFSQAAPGLWEIEDYRGESGMRAQKQR